MLQQIENIKHLKNMCFNFFENNGYLLSPEEPIVPLIDRSVLYTNSAIIPFKPMILSKNIPVHPLFILQECIRLHETKYTPQADYFLQRMSCFSMFGVFAPMNTLRKACHDMIKLLLEVLKVPQNKLVFHVASKDKIYWESLVEHDVIILIDKTPPDDYQWGYGLPNVIGRGINIGILPEGKCIEDIHCVDDIDIGQIIILEEKGAPICFEIALGVEAFLWRNSNALSPFAHSEIASFIPYRYEPLYMQLMDSIVLSTVFYGNSVDLHSGISGALTNKGKNRLSSVRKAVKNVAEIYELIKPNFDLRSVVLEYAHYRNFKPERISRLLASIETSTADYRQRENKLMQYSRTCAHDVLSNKISCAEAYDKLKNKALKKYNLFPLNIRSSLTYFHTILDKYSENNRMVKHDIVN